MADHDVGRFAARRISGLHYVPEFVTEAEEEALLRSIRAPENDRRWTSGDAGRRVGNWGGRPSDADVSEPLPVWATAIVDALFARRFFEAPSESAPGDARAATLSTIPPNPKPNHVPVNSTSRPRASRRTTTGAFAPKVAILTLGDALIDFWENRESGGVRRGRRRGGEGRRRRKGRRLARRSRRPLAPGVRGQACGLRHGIGVGSWTPSRARA